MPGLKIPSFDQYILKSAAYSMYALMPAGSSALNHVYITVIQLNETEVKWHSISFPKA